MTQAIAKSRMFYGWKVVSGTFVLAIFGWGLGFYGPPIYLQTVYETRGWSIALVSAAVTFHYLCGAALVANLPRLYRRFGVPAITCAGSLSLAAGLVGWAEALEPWHLFAACVLTGCGWVTMAAAAINTILSPWFVTLRPKALSTAYNGASIGGVVFQPLWVVLIAQFGFAHAALAVGAIMLIIVWAMSATLFRRSPQDMDEIADGATGLTATKRSDPRPPLDGATLWRDWSFLSLAAAMAFGLFAQIGMLAHLFSLIVPVLGKTGGGLAAGLATASAIAGRTVFGWLLRPQSDRRLAATASYAIQLAGLVVFAVSGLHEPAAIIAGIALFGFGIGNATSLPPLIAQNEFAVADLPRVVALIVAIAQGFYAFAPAFFGLIRSAASTYAGILVGEGSLLALVAALGMISAIALLWSGRRRV